MTVALVVTGILALLPYRHFLSDDGFIYLRFIRNFSETGILSYNLPTPTYGFTGPLWVIIAGGLNRVIGDPFVAVKILAFVLSGIAVAVYFQLCCRFVRHEGYAVLATLALVLDPWFAKWMVSGLENPLTLVILFSSLLLHIQTRGTERFSVVGYTLAGLGVLSRPEMALFIGILLLDILLFERQKRFSKLFLAGLCVGLPGFVWMIYAQLSFGTFIPNTIVTKSIEAHSRSTYIKTLVRCAQIIGGSSILPCLAALGLGAVALRRKELSFDVLFGLLNRYFVLVVWCVGLIAFYVAGKATVSGRYLIAMTPIASLLGVVALEELLSRISSPRWRPAFAIVFGLTLLAQLVFLQARYTYFVTEWKQGMDPNLIEIAVWLRDNTPKDTIITAHEIGVLGYFSERTILDTGGLCSPEFIPYLDDPKKLRAYLRSLEPEYIMTIGPFGALEDAEGEVVLALLVQREGSSAIGRPKTYHLTRLTYPNSSASHETQDTIMAR